MCSNFDDFVLNVRYAFCIKLHDGFVVILTSDFLACSLADPFGKSKWEGGTA